jgi:RNA polymerase sigma factor (sigma-70 family)
MTGVISSAILRTQTDERLVALSRTGHKRAFEAIAERYRAELTRALRRSLPSASVEDALQQVHLQAWQALAAGTEVRELRAWLHRIARNAAIAAASRGYDYDELKDALLVSPGPEEDLERRDAVRRTLQGIAELPERQREALLAVAVEGRSHAEVGFDLGITDTAARQLVRRARVSLIGLMSVATPPQLVEWAARAGHSALAGKAAAGKAAAGKAAAGKAAAGKAAAGTGIGGSLGGSALKVGVIAVTVGGVAAGVPPIRHALVPPSPPASAVHRQAAAHARRPPVVAVASAVTAPLAGSASARGARGARGAGPRSTDARRRSVRDAGPLLVASVDPAPAVAPVTASVPPTGAATASSSRPGGSASPTSPASTPPATPAAQTIAALWAWWLAHHAHGSSPSSRTTAAGGASTGQSAAGGTSQTAGQPANGGGSPGCPGQSTSAASSGTASGSASASGSGSGSGSAPASTSSADPSRSASTQTSDQRPSAAAGGNASAGLSGGPERTSSGAGSATGAGSSAEPSWLGNRQGSKTRCPSGAGQTGSVSPGIGP